MIDGKIKLLFLLLCANSVTQRYLANNQIVKVEISELNDIFKRIVLYILAIIDDVNLNPDKEMLVEGQKSLEFNSGSSDQSSNASNFEIKTLEMHS